MKIRSLAESWVLPVSSGICAVLFAIGLARYATRLPHDWVGIALYAVATVAFAINAAVFTYAKWLREQRQKQSKR